MPVTRADSDFSRHVLFARKENSRVIAGNGGPLAPHGTGGRGSDFEPPEKHVAADRIDKILGGMAGEINSALSADDDPVVLNRKGRHVSIKDLERLIDEAVGE